MLLRERFFRILARLVTRHNKKTLAGCLIITVAMIIAAGRLGMKTQFAEMMPQDIPQIKEYMDIIEDYSSDVTVMITIESEDRDIAQMRTAADELAGRLSQISIEKPAEGAKLNLGQRIALMRGKRPAGIEFDTLGLVRRIDYRIDNEFISTHGLIIQKTADLENTVAMFKSLALPDIIKNINDNFEKEYIEDSGTLGTLDGEAQAVQGLEGMRRFMESLAQYMENGDSSAAAEAVSDFVTGPQYFLSPDNTMLLMMLQPSISFNEFEDLIYLGYRIDDTLHTMQEVYPALKIGRTGAMMMQIDENKALADDFGWPSVFALLFILILLAGSFRAWKTPFLSVVTLVVGIIWTTGILALTLHYLNMMSAGFGLVLIGLGIDFGIHFISGFRDGRELGKSVEESIFYMYERVGAGVVTGALTTAIVFFSLILTQFEAYSQMGIAMGIGIISVLAAQMIMLPALIVWDNKGYSVTGNALRRMGLGFAVSSMSGAGRLLISFFALPVFSWVCRPLQFGFLSAMGRFLARTPAAVAVLVVSALLAALSIKGALELEWEYDMMKLMPRNTLSHITQDKILDRFEMSPDFAMVKAENEEDCRRLVEEFRKVADRTGVIGSIDAVTEFLPLEEVQRNNIPVIENFRKNLSRMNISSDFTENEARKLAAELRRLHQNIVEIGELSIMSGGENGKITRKCDQMVGKRDEDSRILAIAETIESSPDLLAALGGYQKIAGSVLKARLENMSRTDIVTLENLHEDIRKRYVNSRNDNLLINVYPKGYIWDEQNLKRFNEHAFGVTERITGMPAIIQIMMQLMAEKGRFAVTIGGIAILAFLMIDFRSVKYTLLAAIPLAIGTSWMLGLIAASGMKLSIMNFMSLPLIIGIGIDDGVHILHRYRIEGRGSVPLVLKFTGRAILLTSLTTMIGFGSMGLASHKGMAALGSTLFFGVGACFMSSACVLPAIITLWERINGKKTAKTGGLQ